MAKLILDINDNDLSVRAEGSITTDNILLRGSISFSAGWEKYAKTVVFYQNPRKTYRVIVSGEEIDVPSEAVKVGGHLFVGVYGIYTEDGTVYRKVTNIASVPVTAGAYDEANTPEPPTVTEYEQMISIMQAYMDAAEVTERAERAAAQIDAKESEANAYADEANAAANAAKKDAESASASALSAASSASASSVSQKAAETAKTVAESNASSASASAQNAKTYSEAAEASAKSAADTVAVSDISQLANALKGERRGEVLSLGEVSPIPHKVKVTARSKNLLPFPYSTTGYKEQSGGKFTVQGDGGIALSGTPTAYASIQLYNGKPFSKGVVTLSLQGTFTSAAFDIALQSNGVTIASPSTAGTTLTINFADYPTCDAFLIGIKRGANGVEMTGTVYVMVEEGSNVTEWSLYVDVAEVSLKSCGKNLLPNTMASYEISGLTITVNSDKSITVNGTAIHDVYPVICDRVLSDIVVGKNYVLSGCPMGGGNTYRVYITDTNHVAPDVADTGNSKIFVAQSTAYKALLAIYAGTTVNNLTFYPQIELGDTATEYEQYKAGETVAVADASGQAELASVAPNMTVLADREGVLLGCEYNEDANKVIKKLIAAVKELGGNI